jgi:hypothetical protein
MRHVFVLAMITSVLMFAVATPAAAAGPTQSTITFDLSSATCSQLPAGIVIHGAGTVLFTATANGGLHHVITGTATDGKGGFWRFNYAQDQRPLGEGTFEVTDHFNLVGSGSPIKLHSHFVADFSSSDLETAELLALKQIHGEPIGCDPI